MRHAEPVDLAVAACAVAFIVVLAVAAYWDPSIRLLHLFEALPFLLAAWLALRQGKLGYALGVASGAFWLWTAGFRTTFIRNGFERLAMLVRTGSVDRPDILIAVPAALAAGGLVFFCALGYARLRSKSMRDSVLLAPLVILVPAFFVAIFAAFAPRYLGMFQGLLR